MINRILIWSMIRTRTAALAQSGNRFSENRVLKHNRQPREESMKKFYLSVAAIAASVALPGLPAMAQTNEITIGISITTTGPAAALGIPERNSLDFVPKEIGGVPLKVIVLAEGRPPAHPPPKAPRLCAAAKA